jgi:hypothetical protein
VINRNPHFLYSPCDLSSCSVYACKVLERYLVTCVPASITVHCRKCSIRPRCSLAEGRFWSLRGVIISNDENPTAKRTTLTLEGSKTILLPAIGPEIWEDVVEEVGEVNEHHQSLCGIPGHRSQSAADGAVWREAVNRSAMIINHDCLFTFT